VEEFWRFIDYSYGRVENEMKTIRLTLGKVKKMRVAVIEFEFRPMRDVVIACSGVAKGVSYLAEVTNG